MAYFIAWFLTIFMAHSSPWFPAVYPAAIAHRNYFFQSIKQNKSSAPFENFESLQSYDIKVCFLITLYAGALQLY